MRVADAGGWTDTWFAGRGRVCALACRPGAVAEVRAVAGPGRLTLRVPDFGAVVESVVGARADAHPLLAEAVARHAPPGLDLDVTVACAVPPGSGVGTSAAVTVALVAALARLAGDDEVDLARAAHAVETDGLGLQSGVQDQAASVHGGALDLDVRYPEVRVSRVAVDDATWADLERRVVTVHLGRPHRSSAIHRQVIAALEAGPDPRLDRLRSCAARAADALRAGDLDAWGDALIDNHEGQRALHPALVSPLADAVVEVARRCGAVGWKVNGAGGDGGTVTIVSALDDRELRAGLASAGHRVLDLVPCREGLLVTGGR